MSTLNDIVKINVLEHKLNMDATLMDKNLPIRDSMNMTQYDYR